MIISSPSQKCGRDRPTSANVVAVWSEGFPRRTAAITPAGIPISMPTRIERSASSREIGIRDTIVCATGSLRLSSPRLPCSARQTHLTYCTGSGRSSPYSCRTAAITAGSLLSPLSAIAGSPGSARTPTNTSTLAQKTTTRAAPALRRRKPPIVSRPRPRLLGERGELRADQTVAVHLHAGHVLRHAEVVDRVVQVDQRLVGVDHLQRRVVERVA